MFLKALLFLLYLVSFSLAVISPNNKLFDYDLYEEVLDPGLCNEQLEYLYNNSMAMLPFQDSGFRIPSGLLTGSLSHWGNFYQCLDISQTMTSSVIEGKYCTISVPIDSITINLPDLPTLPELPIPWTLDEPTLSQLKAVENLKQKNHLFAGHSQSLRNREDSPFSSLSLDVAICIPKSCSPVQRYGSITGDQSIIQVNFTEKFCRLPGDKPFAPADYVAIVIFSIIGLLLILSTAYDLHHVFVLKRESKKANTLLASFSVYTNTRRLLSFNSPPGTLHCLDGIRGVAMLWVIIGHTFFTATDNVANTLDSLQWILDFSSIWLISAPISVDTFFMMSGLLIVYTTVGKFTRMRFLRSLHQFYLLRYLRLLPLLAVFVLLQASLFHHFSDGPYWNYMGNQVQNCRDNWWVTLLYVQNYVRPYSMCLGQTWYLAVDMQLHWLSPLVLVWIFGTRRSAKLALCIGLVGSLVAGTVFNFVHNFAGSHLSPSRDLADALMYFRDYYINTLTRASPFFVGMIFGYLLHLNREKKVHLSKIVVCLFWVLSLVASSFAIFIIHPLTTMEYDNQLFDNLINSFMRPLWAAALGWMIFACTHGFGGPINWFLTLPMWKLIARLSYAMYLSHYPLMYMLQGSLVRPIYFQVSAFMYRFLSDLLLTFIVSFVVTLFVDSPFSTLIKLFMGGNKKPRSQQAPPVKEEPSTTINVEDYVIKTKF